MPNSEFRSPKEARIANSESANQGRAGVFGLRDSDFFRISGPAPGGDDHGPGTIWQARTPGPHAAPVPDWRLPNLLRTPRPGRGRPPNPEPEYPQGLSVPFEPSDGRGRSPPAEPEVLGVDRIGTRRNEIEELAFERRARQRRYAERYGSSPNSTFQ